MPSVIALDAMGSDRAPKPEIEGAIQAARHHGAHVVLVGPEDIVRAELMRYPLAVGLPIEIVHASEVITMEDKAVQAVRAKRDSSLRVGLRLVREGSYRGICDRRQYRSRHGRRPKWCWARFRGSTGRRWQRFFLPPSAPLPSCWMWALTSTASRTTSNSSR